ncbi:MAG: AAA family ATPase [Myxococcales bacterium]|nr:AAA family ATPase [Myxococcales bacterium]
MERTQEGSSPNGLPRPELPRLLKPPRQSFFLFGPRGTGKSTWVRQHFPGAKRIDLLAEGLFLELLRRPESFGDRLRALRPHTWVCVDEVQRLPSLLNDVHRFIEERDLRFALAGSSARRLRRGGVNLLAGRALRKSLYPFLPFELEGRFALEDALRAGTLPVVLASERPDETLRAYVQSYLKEEVQAEALVRNLPGFARFLPVAALMHGQTVNVSGLARDSGVSRTTVDEYVSILEDTLLAWRLPGFEAKLRVRERKHPKLHWIDPGLVRAAKGQRGRQLQRRPQGVRAALLPTRQLTTAPQARPPWPSGRQRRPVQQSLSAEQPAPKATQPASGPPASAAPASGGSGGTPQRYC